MICCSSLMERIIPKVVLESLAEADFSPDWACLTVGPVKIPAGHVVLLREVSMGKKRKKMRGTVEKIIKPASPMEPERAQITIPEADDLYREVRVENVVTDESGEKAGLKPGAEVDVIVEADSSATIKKP